MLGNRDTFEFIAAEQLGKTPAEIRAMPARDLEDYRAFCRVRAELRELHGNR